LTPIVVTVAVTVLLVDGRPVLFRQSRPGLHGRLFMLRKFRTMREPTASEARATSDHARVSRLGAFLRRTSLDELPTLWNVIVGDMSIVGPRPLLVEYLPLYTTEQARRHDVRPGLTGLAAAEGRHDLPFSRRLELDVWYVEHRSLALDASIVWRTLRHSLGGQQVQDVAAVDDLGFIASCGRAVGYPTEARHRSQ
jgi:sugar transferase EpsL